MPWCMPWRKAESHALDGVFGYEHITLPCRKPGSGTPSGMSKENSASSQDATVTSECCTAPSEGDKVCFPASLITEMMNTEPCHGHISTSLVRQVLATNQKWLVPHAWSEMSQYAACQGNWKGLDRHEYLLTLSKLWILSTVWLPCTLLQVVYEEESKEPRKDTPALGMPLDGPISSSRTLKSILKHTSFMGPAGYRVWKTLHLNLDITCTARTNSG